MKAVLLKDTPDLKAGAIDRIKSLPEWFEIIEK